MTLEQLIQNLREIQNTKPGVRAFMVIHADVASLLVETAFSKPLYASHRICTSDEAITTFTEAKQALQTPLPGEIEYSSWKAT